MRSVYDNLSVGAISAVFNTTNAVLISVNGPSVDTKGYNSAALRVFTTPTGTGLLVSQQVSVVAVLQESADNITFTTANDNTGTPIGVTVNATTTAVIGSARIEGLGQNRLRYLRVNTKGSSLGVIASAVTSVAVIELGRAFQLPTTTGTSNT